MTREKEPFGFRALFSKAPIGCLCIGPEGRIVGVNTAQLRILCQREAEVLGRRVTTFFSEQAQVQALRKLMGEGNTVSDFHARLRQKNGSCVDVLIDVHASEPQCKNYYWFVRDISERAALERELIELTERERQRVGHELHDGLGQHLCGVYFLAGLLHKNLSTEFPSRAEDARRLCKLLREATELTRGLAHGLEPVPPVPSGLIFALEKLTQRIRALYSIGCRFQHRGRVAIRDSVLATHLFRIAQEAINNSIKHGHAREICVGLSREKDGVTLQVRDNGVGIRRVTRRTKGIGLSIMQSRARAVDGTLIVRKHPAGGTEVLCAVPKQILTGRP